MLEKARKTIEQHNMLHNVNNILVALSGGPDSLVLLDVLYKLRGDYQLVLEIFHVNHGLRAESMEEEEFIRKVAEYYDLAFSIERVEVEKYRRGGERSPEEAARLARYDAFQRRLRSSGFQRMALGHHADDRVETFLLRLITGAGLSALASIPPVRGPFIRPLAEVWRAEINTYAKTLPFTPLQDPSNQDLSIPRNRVRHLLIPLLEKSFNPSVKSNLIREIELLREEWEEGDGDQSEYLRGSSEDYLDIAFCRRLSVAGQRRLFREMLLRRGIPPSFRRIEDLRLKILGGKNGSMMHLPGGWMAVREYQRVRFCSLEDLLPPREEAEAEIPGEGVFPLAGFGMEIRLRMEEFEKEGRAQIARDPWQASLDWDKLVFPLRLRYVHPGDRFQPLGAPGMRKRQDFLVDLKVPRRYRAWVIVVLAEGEIVWVPGYRIDERFKVTPSTTRIAQMELKLDEETPHPARKS